MHLKSINIQHHQQHLPNDSLERSTIDENDFFRIEFSIQITGFEECSILQAILDIRRFTFDARVLVETDAGAATNQ